MMNAVLILGNAFLLFYMSLMLKLAIDQKIKGTDLSTGNLVLTFILFAVVVFDLVILVRWLS